MSTEAQVQREMLERLVEGGKSLGRILAECGIDRRRLAGWLADTHFRELLDDAMTRWRLMQKVELMMQQSILTKHRSDLLEKTDEDINPKVMATAHREVQQALGQLHREERDLRRSELKRAARPIPVARPHPDLDEAEVERLFAEMDRIDRFWESPPGSGVPFHPSDQSQGDCHAESNRSGSPRA